MDGPNIQRLYYSTSDISRILGIHPDVVRSWVKKFLPLRPSKSKAGRLLFRPDDVEIVRMITQLKACGYTDEKVNSVLENGVEGLELLPQETFDTENNQRQGLAAVLYSGLQEILHILEEG